MTDDIDCGEIKASEVMEGTTLHINARFFFVEDWRFKLGLALFRLGAWIMGASAKLEEGEQP